MLRTIRDLKNDVLKAKDGEIGRCKDFLFDDRHWTVRYMVADTGKWLPGRKILISPLSLLAPDEKSRLPVNLTKKQIEDSPPIDEDMSVSRKYELRYFKYYGWPYYWIGGQTWGQYPTPALPVGQTEHKFEEKPETFKTHLRSAREVMGYHIEAKNGKIGHVEDFLVDVDPWTIRYMIIDTRNWLPGKKVVISPQWTEDIDWVGQKISVALSREKIERSPEYQPTAAPTRDYEKAIHEYYDFPMYWT